MINVKTFDIRNFGEVANMYHDYMRVINGLESVTDDEYDEILALLMADTTKNYTLAGLHRLLEGTEYVFMFYAAETEHDWKKGKYGREMLIEDSKFDYGGVVDISKCRTISFYSAQQEYLDRNKRLRRFVFCCHKLWKDEKLSLRAYIYKKPSAL
jgi:hypothetical protein